MTAAFHPAAVPASRLLPPFGSLRGAVRILVPGTLALLSAWAILTLPQSLAAEGRVALTVTVLALIGWVGTRLPESVVALCAALALVLAGAVPEDRLYAALGSDLVWLLLAAFLIAAVIKESGLAGRLVAPLTARRPGFAVLMGATATVTAATAFVLPSTSGRAALLLPVFLALLPTLPDARLGSALALMFPTVILLSAGGSLIGAGAHLVAVEAIAATGGPRIGYLDWMLLGAPLALLASAAGVALILILFVPRGLWGARVGTVPAVMPDARQRRIALVLAGLVGLWLTESVHGLGMALVAVVGSVVLLTPPFTAKKTKDLFRGVDMELILYMAATMLIAQSMTSTGADRWLAAQALAALPAGVLQNGTAIAVALSVVAVLAHLAIASRSARAAVLIPAVALPLAGMGHDATLMVLVAVMGTGFCQTLMASAKPVAIFGTRDEAGFSQADLFRLALPLGLVKTGLLVAFATLVWPAQIGAPPAPPAPPAAALPPVITSVASPATAIAAPNGAALRLAPAAGPEVPAAVVTDSATLRPMPRPERLSVAAPAPERAREPPRTVRQASLGAKIRRDFKAAGRQLRRDFRSLF
jgi:di/tricarboxylate transporter